jgi:hypothetical protein
MLANYNEQIHRIFRVFLIFSGSSPILKNNGISPKLINIFPHSGKAAPLISKFCIQISYFCPNYSIATAVKLQIKTESFHLLFTYPYWNLALIKGENPFHLQY